MWGLINFILGRVIYEPSTLGSVMVKLDNDDQLGIVNVVRVVTSKHWVEVITKSTIMKFPREGVVYMTMLDNYQPGDEDEDEEPERGYLH